MNVMNSWLSRAPQANGHHGRFRQHNKIIRRRWMASPLFVVVVIAGLVVVGLVFRGWRRDFLPSPPPPPSPQTPPLSEALAQLFDRQSRTLAQATARYVLRNGRAPPRGYDRWFAHAQANGCLVDEYEQVWADFAPFWQVAERDGGFFGKMVGRGVELAKEEDLGMKTFTVKKGVASMTDDRRSNYDDGWMGMLNNISTSLGPSLSLSLDLLINHRDEPRVAFSARAPFAQDPATGVPLLNPNPLPPHDAISLHPSLALPDSPPLTIAQTLAESALTLRDATPFRNTPTPTSAWYTDAGHCLVPNAEMGFVGWANKDNSFLLYSASADFTTDLYPVLSQSKIEPCFGDVLFPSEYHYPRSYTAPKYAFPDNVPWAEKRGMLYWRGQSTGGWISGTNYHHFPRFKLIDIARSLKHHELFDVAISAFYEHFCQLEGCYAARIKEEYNITAYGTNAPREDVYRYKYVFDVDGNTFSGRFLGLLRSGSLVFKSTVFTEYFSAWLRPFEHYIPVLPDLSDLVERIEWARAHDAEARRIQQAGKEFAERVITDAQNDCYWYLVLLEWAAVQGG
ncbi:glycosyl transferase family 90-domain-containing protein [Mycena vitilis]|nr:glycosyl transferase family 90-domain-containing protein [Mycena vitilis]